MMSEIFWFCVGIATMATIQAVVVAYLLVKFCRQNQNSANFRWTFSPPSATEQPYQRTANRCQSGRNRHEKTIGE